LLYSSVSQNLFYMSRAKNVNIQEIFSTGDVLIITLYGENNMQKRFCEIELYKMAFGFFRL